MDMDDRKTLVSRRAALVGAGLGGAFVADTLLARPAHADTPDTPRSETTSDCQGPQEDRIQAVTIDELRNFGQGAGQNLLPMNVATGTDTDKSINGFRPYKAAVIKSDTEHAWRGDRSLSATSNPSVSDFFSIPSEGTLPVAGRYAMSCYVYIPGTFPTTPKYRVFWLADYSYTGSTVVAQQRADLSKRDTWQRIWLVLDVASTDLQGYWFTRMGAHLPATGPVFFDGFQFERLSDSAESPTAWSVPSTPQTDIIYYVTDPGQEGAFRYDPDDHSTQDNTGLVLVSANGHRFRRIVDGPLRISWFGAKADYDQVDGTGTPNDDALEMALAALGDFSLRTKSKGGFEVGLPPIVFGAGNYLFTRKGAHPAWYSAIKGLTLQGQGMNATTLFFDCPEDANGTDNYFLVNNNHLYGLQAHDLGFHGVSGTERFVRISSKGTAGKTLFTNCQWVHWKVGFDVVESRANADLNKFAFCRTRSMPEGSVFFNCHNPQSVINSFVDCDFHSHGTIFNFVAGGILTVVGGSYITFAEGCVLNIDDPTGAGVGVGNGQFLFVNMKPEIRTASALAKVNAPEAHVEFRGCQLATGLSNFAKNWSSGHAYVVGDRVRTGASHASLGRAFRCTRPHTSSAGNEPLSGDHWRDVWEPLYEIRIDRGGAVRIDGGTFAYAAGLHYRDDSYQGVWRRPVLSLSGGCYLVNPLANVVDFIPSGRITKAASRPRASADGCRPYTGSYPNAYWVTPSDPVDVTLNARYGFDGASVPLHRYVFTASPQEGEGLPSQDDGEQTFLLPRGAQIANVRLVTDEPTTTGLYTVTNHDGTVSLLPDNENARPHRSESWYRIETEEQRTIVVTSRAPRRADGFIVVEYM